MPKWTKEQEEAIKSSGENIIVSAGAGSGKTAVLSARVIDKLKLGVHIEELLIMTFTAAAAGEMKTRIREELKKMPSLSQELINLDQAYITTFDSFSLSVLKKYHYVLGIDKDINIIESSLLMMKKNEIMDDVFLSFYRNKDVEFLNMIDIFCVKDDESIRKLIIDIANKLELKWDLEIFLDNYISEYYSEENFNNFYKEYQDIIVSIKKEIKMCEDDIYSVIGSDYGSKVSEVIKNIYDIEDISQLKSILSLRLPNLPKESDENAKNCKENLSQAIKSLKEILVYGNEEEMKLSFFKTKDYAKVIISILKEYFERLNQFKRNGKVYDFIDIAKMSIKIVKENSTICEELKASYKEILVDEYQDTNDLQEEFISLISNDNVYMVGDIKQSIYRFRNANPNIFRNKYNSYSNHIGGKKIDLLSNFRSRREVLDDINKIFRQVMDDSLGGADYVTSHQMVFGNDIYEKEGDGKENSSSEVWQYDKEENSLYTNEEIEAFLVFKDISEKVKSQYKVYDKKKSIRNVNYSDFLILMDRSSSFDLYKNIANYLGIPITLYKDENLDNSDETYLLSNILDFIISIRKKEFSGCFKRDFVSIARSFLYSMSDDEIYKYIKNGNIWDSIVYKDLSVISFKIDVMDTYHVLKEIIDKLKFYEKSISALDQEACEVRIQKMLELARNLSNLGYDVYQFSSYLKDLISSNHSIKYSLNVDNNNSVKIMTIHKSKGLDGTICYFTGLYKKFNIRDISEKFIYNEKYRLVLPYYNEGIAETFVKFLCKNDYMTEEISEKIRLFYVALTRAREKMIFVLPKFELRPLSERLLDYNVRNKFRSFMDIMSNLGGSILNQVKEVDYLSHISKDYLFQNNKESLEILDNGNIEVNELPLVLDERKESRHFSKETNKIFTKEEINNMEFGIKVHEYLEYIDFKEPRFDLIDNNFIRDKIKAFLGSKLLLNIKDAQIFKEYEFVYEDVDNVYHGIIDCMLVYSSHIDIIDYKLSNVEDEAYINQLNGYKDYIEKITGKKVRTYLYSILDGVVKEIGGEKIAV